MSEREKILDLIKSRMKGWSRHSVEYITLDLLMQKITQLPAAEEVKPNEIVRYRLVEKLGDTDIEDEEFFKSMEAYMRYRDMCDREIPMPVRVAIRRLEDKE
jgi:hypothetical protein